MGLSKKELRDIIDEVRANAARLESCEGPHDFQPESGATPRRPGDRYKCTKCGGMLGAIERLWYERGLKDAARLKGG